MSDYGATVSVILHFGAENKLKPLLFKDLLQNLSCIEIAIPIYNCQHKTPVDAILNSSVLSWTPGCIVSGFRSPAKFEEPMTYCVAMNLSEGLVFASDSRTNAGTDYVTSYSKMHQFRPSSDRFFTLLSAGNLATTQEVINHIKRDLDHSDQKESLLTAGYMFEVADYIGRVTNEVQRHHNNALQQAGVSGEVTWILGGQISGQPHSLLLIYPQGNYIESSIATPYLQIGETKYGKPVLDRVLTYDTSLDEAAKLALVSLTSTANSNITVGPPFELSIYRSGEFQADSRCKFESDGEYLPLLENAWRDGLNRVFNTLPPLAWGGQVQQQMELSPAVNSSNDLQAPTNVAQPVPINKPS